MLGSWHGSLLVLSIMDFSRFEAMIILNPASSCSSASWCSPLIKGNSENPCSTPRVKPRTIQHGLLWNFVELIEKLYTDGISFVPSEREPKCYGTRGTSSRSFRGSAITLSVHSTTMRQFRLRIPRTSLRSSSVQPFIPSRSESEKLPAAMCFRRLSAIGHGFLIQFLLCSIP